MDLEAPRNGRGSHAHHPVTTPAGPPRSAEEQARFEHALREMFEQHISFNQLLGLQILAMQPGDVRGRFGMRPELVGHFAYGRLHGGVISSVLDAMGGLALMVAIAERHPHEGAMQVMHRFARMGTIDLRIDFLRQGIGKHFDASAQVTRLGGRIGSTQMALHSDSGELIATGAAAFVVS
ncbi:MAG: thioesterase family protein [Rubrivivax sp.]|nr:thioesterase family protein [Rubrivivax sp.]